MALATLDDLAAIGAVRVDQQLTDADAQRANRLLEFASAEVCIHFGTTEAVIQAWTATEVTLIAAVVAECAAQRMTSPAAATAQQLGEGVGNWTKTFLTPAMKRRLNSIRRGNRGTGSVEVSFASSNPVEWENWPSLGSLPSDEDSFR